MSSAKSALLTSIGRLAAPVAAVVASASFALAQGAAPTPPTGAAPTLRLPSLGESASDEFSIGAEKRLGEQIMRDIRRDPDYLDDPTLLDELMSIWQPLVAAARARGDIGADTERLFPYEAFLVRDRSVNAFALPGGYVGVHLGLIAMTATRDELASVLAHELSHITQRHIARSIAASSRSSTLGLAGMILGLLAASRSGNADVANAAIMGGQAAMVQAQLNFSRDMEREADRSGFALMGQAGFAPAGMAAMFDRLDVANRLNDNNGFPYLRSHPLTTERIGEARQRVGLVGSEGIEPTAATPRPSVALAPTLGHALMQARAKVLMDAGVSAWRRLQEADRSEAADALPAGGSAQATAFAALYASALASTQLRDFARGERALARAELSIQRLRGGGNPAYPFASADLAQAQRQLAELGVHMALAANDSGRAQTLLTALTPDSSRSDLHLRAEVALAAGQPEALRECSESLQTWVSEHRRDSSGWLLLSRCASRQGQPLRALRAEAESQAALDNLPGAIDRLRAGQQLARRGGANSDFIEASVIDSRLRELLAQRRQLQQEASPRRGASPAPDPQWQAHG